MSTAACEARASSRAVCRKLVAASLLMRCSALARRGTVTVTTQALNERTSVGAEDLALQEEADAARAVADGQVAVPGDGVHRACALAHGLHSCTVTRECSDEQTWDACTQPRAGSSQCEGVVTSCATIADEDQRKHTSSTGHGNVACAGAGA